MSNPLFILYCIPNEKAVAEYGARRTTTSFFAANIRQARAMAVMRFVTKYPEANDEDFEFIVYEDGVGLSRPAPDAWNEEMLYQYEWDEETKRPGKPIKAEEPVAVDFEKLSKTMRLCVLVKYRTTEINSNQLPAALELTQDDVATFDGHIVETISKMPAIVEMFPDRIVEVVEHIHEKCGRHAKWPEMKAVAAAWLKQHEQERKDGNTDVGIAIVYLKAARS